MKKTKFDSIEGVASAAQGVKADLAPLPASWFGAAGDGVTNDSAAFTTLEVSTKNQVIDLRGLTHVVSAIPTGNVYINGSWLGPFENWEDTSDLTQPHWGKTNITIGGTNVVIPTTLSSAAHYLSFPPLAVMTAFPLYVRVRAKASGYNVLRLRLANSITGAFISDAFFNLSTGEFSSSSESLSNADGSGYRIGVAKFTVPADITLISIRAYIYDTLEGLAYSGDGVKGIEITDMKFGAYPIPALQHRGLISSNRDTGGVGQPYAGGIYGNDSYSGRTTYDLFILEGSQGSRAAGPSRAGVYSSIYSAAFGNVSGILAGRHSWAGVPQSVIIGSEECGAGGSFRAVINASINSFTTGESNFIAACRASYVSSRNGSAISSSGVFVGRGGGWRPNVAFSGGSITGVTTARDLYGTLAVGSRYKVNQTIKFVDRVTGAADAYGHIVSVDAIGGFLTAAIDVAGTGYGTTPAPDGKFYVDAYVDDDSGDFSVAMACSGYMELLGLGSAAIASSGTSTIFGRVGGDGSAVVATKSSFNDADTSLITASNNAFSTSGTSMTAAIAANNSGTSASESVVFGRNTINPTTLELAGGYSTVNTALSANRKWSISNQTGAIKSVTTFAASGTFADFGEYVENKVKGVIPYGTIVMLEGDCIVKWDGKGEILGVVSATVAFMGNDSDFQWQGRYLKGEFGEQLYGDPVLDPNWTAEIPDPNFIRYNGLDLTVPMIPNPEPQGMVTLPLENPDYDPSKELISRSNRPEEWSPVGLLGQVFTRVDATVKPDDVIGGKLRVMKITKDYNKKNGYAVAKCFIF